MLSLLFVFSVVASGGEFKPCAGCSEPLREKNILRAQDIYGYNTVIQGEQDEETASAWIYWPPTLNDQGVCVRNVVGINGRVKNNKSIIWENVTEEKLAERMERVIWILPGATKEDCKKINLSTGVWDRTSIEVDTLIRLNKKIPELLSSAKYYPDVSVGIRVPKDTSGYRINRIETKEDSSYRLHVADANKKRSRNFLMTVKVVDDNEYWVVYLDELVY